jgi:hypothetical protein
MLRRNSFIFIIEIIFVSREFIPLTDVHEVNEEYYNYLDQVKDKIKKRNIPDWMLVPGRSSGEHATGNAWLGVVMSICAGSNPECSIDTRIAINTEERHNVKSNVGELPREILHPIRNGIEKIDEEVDICVGRIRYNKDKELQDLELLLRLKESEE